MRNPKFANSPGNRGFTLIELLAVITIIALLSSLGYPVVQLMMARANSTKCANNLRQVGIAVNLFLADHNYDYPEIETDPTNPVYPPDQGAKGMAATLAPYGVTPDVLKCPVDLSSENNFARVGTSYEWRPILDDENSVAPKVYWRARATSVSAVHIRISTDFERYHFGKMNALYGDGHVKQALP